MANLPSSPSSPKSLASFLSYDAPPPLALILPLFARLITALHSIHAASPNAAHQPLTPESILLSENHPHVPILKTSPIAKQRNLSETIVFSKPKYSAPDAFLLNTTTPCAAIDTYVIAFIFYEILCGQRIFRSQFAALDDGPPTLWLKWHLDPSAKPRPLREIRPDLGRLASVIDAMLEKDPAKRTQTLASVAALVSDLDERTDQNLRANLNPNPPPPPSPPTTITLQPPKKTSFFLNPWLVTGLIVGLTIGTLLYLLLRT